MGWLFDLLVDFFWTRWKKPDWLIIVLLNLCVLVLCWLLGGWYWAAAPVALALPWYVYSRFDAGVDASGQSSS